MGVLDRLQNLFGRSPTDQLGESGIGIEYYNHYSVDLANNVTRGLSYWKHNSIFIENIYNKIANDVSLVDFKHVKINRLENSNDSMKWLENSDISYVLNRRTNSMETPTVFWVRVIRRMLKDDISIVIPVYKNGQLIELELVHNLISYDGKYIYFTLANDGIEQRYEASKCLIFENPREGLTNSLNNILDLINRNIDRIMEKISSPSSLGGFLKIPTAIKDESMKEKVKSRISNIFDVASNGEIGYLQNGEEFQELNKKFNTASSEELEFLKSQLYNAYGLNENLFNCKYSEMEYRAYHQSVIQPIIRMISEEINYKLFSKTAITQGQKVLVYFDFFNVTSLKDLTEFAHKAKYSAIMSSNEIREIFGYGSYSGGDRYESNLNAVLVGDNNE